MMQKFNQKRKAVSPIIASILLIGLTVLAGAVVVFIVLPMLNPPFDQGKITMAKNGAPTFSSGNTTLKMTITNGNSMAVTIKSASVTFSNTTVVQAIVLPTSLTIAAGNGADYLFVFRGDATAATKFTIVLNDGTVDYTVTKTF